MKKYSILFLLLCLLSACSNDFLDRNPLDTPSNEAFWNTEKDAAAALNGCYNEWWSMDNVVYFDCASDNSYNPYPWEGWQVQANGSATPSDPGTDFMTYKRIVKCNNFLSNISRPKMNEDTRKRMIAEARFLRAWDYFTKVTLYGGVPLVTKVLGINESNLPRNTKEEVTAFVIKELSEAAADLPVSYSGNDLGRITKGAALAVKAKMELFSGQFDNCIATTSEIIKLNYSLMPNYKDVFAYSKENNSEVILDVQYDDAVYTTWVLGVMPPNSSGGWSSINPTQSLVDTYECADGKTISESNLYDPKEPYKNRDPRLSATIVYPGALYNGAYLDPIDSKDPNGDYYAPYGRSKTGYYPRKYVENPTVYADIWKSGMNAIVIRYADVLLMYAEAKIEANKIDATVTDVINQIRQRAGMPAVDQTVYNNQAKLRELVRRERRVELAMEGLRWFDICRWKIGPETMNGKVKGAMLGTVDPNTGALTLNDTQIEVETRVFDANKHYLWAIPQGVIDGTPAIKQNPGY